MLHDKMKIQLQFKEKVKKIPFFRLIDMRIHTNLFHSKLLNRNVNLEREL